MEKEIFKEKSSTNSDFLIAKSENVFFEIPELCRENDFLYDEFPEAEEISVEKINSFTDSLNSFCVISINPDKLPDNMCKNHILEIAAIISLFAEKNKGLWWLQKNYVFSLIIPTKNISGGINTAKKIRNEISDKLPQTVSVGIANYPEIDFSKEDILQNSLKALSHSFFFEGNSIASFDSISLNISGDKLYQEGKIKEAIAEFKNALKMSGNNVNVKNSLGICYADLGKSDEALIEFEEAISLNPDEVMAIHNAGLIYSLKGENEKALSYFLKADSFEPSVFEIKYHLGKYYFDQEDYEKAAFYLKKALEIKESSSALYLYSFLLFKDENYDEAALFCNRAVKMSPNNAKAISLLSELFHKIKENPEITILFAKHAVSLEPKNGLFRKRLGILLYLNRKKEEALSEFETASEMGEEVSEYLSELNQKSA